MQFDAGGLAFHQIPLERLGGLLVVAAPLLEVHAVPLVDLAGDVALDAVPLEQRRHIAQDLLLPRRHGVDAERAVLAQDFCGDGDVGFKEIVAGLVQERREVGVFQEGDSIGSGTERAALDLVEYAVGLGRECTGVAGGGFDLVAILHHEDLLAVTKISNQPATEVVD